MKYALSILSFLLLGLLSCSTHKEWYKGNLHTHSYWSDGDDYPEMIMDWYKTQGYDFAVLSDHNTLQEGEKWKLIPKSPMHEQAYENYLNKYGKEWVESKTDSAGRLHVRLKTLEEYRSLFEEKEKFLIIPSEEVTAKFEQKPLHMNVTNIQEYIEPATGNSVSEVLQRNLDLVKQQREATGHPMFLHINHPNFVWAITPEDMMSLNGERFFEVYNGHPDVHNYGDSLRPSMEALWDRVQVSYLQAGKPLLYGLAVDDAHHYHVFGGKQSNPGRGWVEVWSKSLSPKDLIEAMEAGEFYSSTGVLIHQVKFNGKSLRITVKPEEGVTYTIRFFGTKKSNPEQAGILLSEIQGTEGSYTLEEDDLYVRAKVTSSKSKENPYRPGDMEEAWIQPVMKR
ncbi:histidinol-phosphatase [Algoriphagus sp. CAU 1675]|uniref:histidinol-phosphatase n=1 Tax=Algoriphagus sp. CAU 1675 TaxID=3032597 RepID=UPI0023D9AA62|nr:histidinol-phosphatase [Algoriphagus sp. CAU 1675]MDF2157790.1 histidinol-phosphatase [Algoriphagus sp. CAU 1675]